MKKKWFKMHLNSIFDTQMNWKDIEPPFMYCVFHHISGHFPGQIKFWSILIKKSWEWVRPPAPSFPTKPEICIILLNYQPGLHLPLLYSQTRASRYLTTYLAVQLLLCWTMLDFIQHSKKQIQICTSRGQIFLGLQTRNWKRFSQGMWNNLIYLLFSMVATILIY